MRFAEVMTSDPIVLHPQQTIREAASMFRKYGIDGAPVVDKQGEIIGLFTKSHIMKVVADGIEAELPVKHLMTRNQIITVSPHDKVEDFYKHLPDEAYVEPDSLYDMDEYDLEKRRLAELGRLPVVEDGKVVGMCTRTDMHQIFRDLLNSIIIELDTIIDSVHNPIISVDRRGLIKTFNRSAEKLLGRTAQSVLGKSIRVFFPATRLIETLKTGQVEYSQQIVLEGKKYLSNRSPIIQEDEIIGAVAVLQDITELEEISEELQYTKRLNTELDAIIESSFDGLFVIDEQGVVLRFNNAFERITNLCKEELIGKNLNELIESGIFTESASLQVLAKGEAVSIVSDYAENKKVLITGNPVFNENGAIFRVVTNVRDITELTALRQKLEHVQGLSQHYANQLQELRIKYLDNHKMVINSTRMEQLMKLALRLAQVDSTILVQGESGVGKELIAETIHSSSPRREKSFIKVNCGAIPENLLESELFGYEEGAFTGAKKEGKIGIFELANGGTLFLDEIGELPLNLQVKLLRVLQDREITRVGGLRSIPVDLRIIAGTNQDLRAMVQKRTFREDLFYRLNVVPLLVPPLRDRAEEIPAMVAHFLHKYNQRYSLAKYMTPEVIDVLMGYHWPGNVRELENLVERMVVITPGERITVEDLPSHLAGGRGMEQGARIAVSDIVPLRYAVENVEKQLLEKAFARFKTTRKIARELEIDQSTVVRKAAKYGIK